MESFLRKNTKFTGGNDKGIWRELSRFMTGDGWNERGRDLSVTIVQTLLTLVFVGGGGRAGVLYINTRVFITPTSAAKSKVDTALHRPRSSRLVSLYLV